MRRMLVIAACVALMGPVAWSGESAPAAKSELEMGAGVGVTIYNANFATVKERRMLDLVKGVQTLKFTGVASGIDATSVHFTSLTDPKGVSILEQDYEYDLVSADKILAKYLDKKIDLTLQAAGAERSREVSGFLKSYVGGKLILASKADGGEITILDRSAVRDVRCGELPEGLLTKPTLVWKVDAEKAGAQLCKIAYLTNNMTWACNYTALIKKNDTAIDLAGWVTVTNNSGAQYKEAQIKLIAGDVHRVTPPAYRYGRMREDAAVAEKKQAGFEEKSFAEYHMYTLGRPSTINENQVKQIELIEPALDVPITKYYHYYVGAKRPRVMVEFENTKANKLGVALPKGKVPVYQRDEADASLEFVGEDAIDHTPRDEKVKLYIGDAFDIIGESKQMAYSSGDRWNKYTEEVELRNHKDAEVEIRVEANIGGNGRLESQSVDGKVVEATKLDASRVEWRIKVPANGKAKLVYTVFASW